MAGRGRGSNISFNVEALGFTKGDTLPVAIEQPPPNFPALKYKAVPLLESSEHSYLLAVKQELRATFKDLPYYYTDEVQKKDIMRYSDKYQNGNHDSSKDWQPDWSYFPNELKVRKGKKKCTPNARKSSAYSVTDVNVTNTLKQLEEKEKQQEVGGAGDAGDESDEEKEQEELEEGEQYDEEELEEETDYILPYFDNGEGLDDEDDALDDGPTYS